MYLVYIDESGNTGVNLTDAEQPLFVLAALIVPEACWLDLERDLEQSLAELCPSLDAEAELHATDLRSGRGHFKGIAVTERIAIRDCWLHIAAKHGLKLVYRAIVKRRFQTWLVREFGTGVVINPHVAAFTLISRVVDSYLTALPGKALGMFISDENKEIMRDVEKSIKVLRGIDQGRLENPLD